MTNKSSKKEKYARILAGGYEPTLKGKVFASNEDQYSEVEKAMYWYRQNYKFPRAKEWIVAYLTEKGRTSDAEMCVRGGKSEIKSIAPYCRLLSRGWIPDAAYTALVEKGIAELLATCKSATTTTEVSIQDRIQAKADVLLCEFEPILDCLYESAISNKKKNCGLVDWIKKTDWSRPIVTIVTNRIEKSLVDLRLAQSKKDPQLSEGYSYLKPSGIKKIIAELESAKQEFGSCLTTIISNRKPRKQKIKSPEQLVKSLKYCEKSMEYGIDSCDPCTIIGCQSLLIFNTKNKKATLMIALDPVKGLIVKGSTIIGFSVDKSKEKIVRKPADLIKQSQKIKNSNIGEYLDSLKTKSTVPSGRINKHCILMKSYTEAQ